MGPLWKRYLWWLAAPLALVALAMGVIVVESRRPVNRVGWVYNGMTYREVQGLLGSPDSVQPWWSDGLPCYLWKFRDGSYVWLYMDAGDRVRSREFHSPEPEWRKRLRALGVPL
jgi:hypothetical protein